MEMASFSCQDFVADKYKAQDFCVVTLRAVSVARLPIDSLHSHP